MQSLFNADILVQSVTLGADDEDGNKTYLYSDILTNERCRASVKIIKKLTDDKNWITHKIRRFKIKDIYTDLSKAVYVVYDDKYYKIEGIMEPENFARIKHRIIETEYKEVKV